MNSGHCLKMFRKNRNITQRELAEKLAVSPKSVSAWETGKVSMSLSIIKRLFNAYDITLEEFFDVNNEVGTFTAGVCPICGNGIFSYKKVKFLCCGEEFKEYPEITRGIPKTVIEKFDDKFRVCVDHEQVKSDYISYIVYEWNGGFDVVRLKITDKPEAVFLHKGDGRIFLYSTGKGKIFIDYK